MKHSGFVCTFIAQMLCNLLEFQSQFLTVWPETLRWEASIMIAVDTIFPFDTIVLLIFIGISLVQFESEFLSGSPNFDFQSFIGGKLVYWSSMIEHFLNQFLQFFRFF